MPSLIDVTVPVAGSPTTASLRSNNVIIKSEIEALQAASASSGSRTYGTVETVGRALNSLDIGRTILYSSAATGTFTIPTDTVLGIVGSVETVFRVVQLGTGAVSIVGNGTSINNKPADIPAAIQFSTEVATRYGVQTYVGTRV